MTDESLRWRVRWNTPDGMITFLDIKKRKGEPLGRWEVEAWADMKVRMRPDEFASFHSAEPLDKSEALKG